VLSLGEEEESAGNLVGALPWLRRAISLDPYDEPLLRRLITLLARLGDGPNAVREYEAFERRMAEELKLEPSAETKGLVEEIWAAAADGPTSTPRSAEPLVEEAGVGEREVPASTPAAAAQPKRRRRLLWLVAATGTLLVLLAVVARKSVFSPDPVSGDPAGPALEPNRVLVLPFVNQTGDARLDRLGNMAADWITQGLAQTGLVRAVPTTEVEPLEAVPGLEGPAARARSLAAVSRAAIAVHGSFYLQDDSLAFQAQVTDVATGELLRAIGEITAPVERPKEAVETLRQRTTGALATVLDPLLESWASAASQPPSYEAYQLYAEGMEAFFRARNYEQAPMREAADFFHQATALDATFSLPLLWAVYAHGNAGERARADSVAKVLDARRDRLTQWERALLDAHLARLKGDRPGEYRAYSRVVQMTPGSEWNYKLARAALLLNRPLEAVNLLSEVDPERGWLAHWQYYWLQLTQALHSLGYYEQELREARRGRLQLPESTHLPYSEATALAALGRTDEVWLWIEREIRSPTGYYLVGLANELRIHGHEGAADRVLERAFEWYDQLPGTEITANHYLIAIPLVQANRENDGLRLLKAASAAYRARGRGEHPMFLGSFGVIAAMRGDTSEARAYYERLEEYREAGLGLFDPETGLGPFNQAAIAANLGEKDLAVRLLARAQAELGADLHGWWHQTVRLEPLRNYAPFRELMRPKG
jgi:tetratricopeptide (TPR) repeat protein